MNEELRIIIKAVTDEAKRNIEKVKKELEKVEKDIKFAEGRLNNPGFAAKAPKAVVDAERVKLAKNLEVKEKLLASLAEYEN